MEALISAVFMSIVVSQDLEMSDISNHIERGEGATSSDKRSVQYACRGIFDGLEFAEEPKTIRDELQDDDQLQEMANVLKVLVDTDHAGCKHKRR